MHQALELLGVEEVGSPLMYTFALPVEIERDDFVRNSSGGFRVGDGPGNPQRNQNVR